MFQLKDWSGQGWQNNYQLTIFNCVEKVVSWDDISLQLFTRKTFDKGCQLMEYSLEKSALETSVDKNLFAGNLFGSLWYLINHWILP